MPDFEEKLIQAMKRKREAEGLSLRALSAATGVSFSSLARMERGEGEPDNNSKIRLLQWLGPDADRAGLSFDEDVAFVHFRADRNVQSSTVRMLLGAADHLRRSHGGQGDWRKEEELSGSDSTVALSKDDLEETARRFRADLGLGEEEPLDSLRIEVDGIDVVSVSKTNFLDGETVRHLREKAHSEWSAMSVPVDLEDERWAVLLNDSHGIERQRVTVLEEYWHILLGHRLTRIRKVAESYGRTYDTAEEHDAYYLASASLLPKSAVTKCVLQQMSSKQIAAKYGTSPELVDYRIKRLGLWRQHTGKQIKLASD
jgi:transcriptional regulator with XRE-family HTH domain